MTAAKITAQAHHFPPEPKGRLKVGDGVCKASAVSATEGEVVEVLAWPYVIVDWGLHITSENEIELQTAH